MHTIHTVSALISDTIESDLPDQVLTALAPYHGKNITTRLEKVLPGWTLVRQYGWTALVSEDYYRQSGNTGVKLTIARSESSVPLDLAFVEQENPSYFAGRRERNVARKELLKDHAQLQSIADAMNAVEATRKAAAAAEALFNDITPSAVRYTLNALLEKAAA